MKFIVLEKNEHQITSFAPKSIFQKKKRKKRKQTKSAGIGKKQKETE